jgi:hypothetical protein
VGIGSGLERNRNGAVFRTSSSSVAGAIQPWSFQKLTPSSVRPCRMNRGPDRVINSEVQ